MVIVCVSYRISYLARVGIAMVAVVNTLFAVGRGFRLGEVPIARYVDKLYISPNSYNISKF